MKSASLRKTFCNRIISPTLRRMSSGCFETLERGQRRCPTRPLAPWPFVVALHGVTWPLSPKTHEDVELKKVERATSFAVVLAHCQLRFGPLSFFRKMPSGVKSLPDPGRDRNKSGDAVDDDDDEHTNQRCIDDQERVRKGPNTMDANLICKWQHYRRPRLRCNPAPTRSP